ncbi:unnamed protein product [Caenorhabditis auriculariae]|uniref:Uncharacterized protein n=1 Tax=Caenorhabditis auriculariae TaxID=2777116 RepID=A0A8S1HFN2_9PELO|nr:unnamed protein product [Caenorhabditis auriculariae]
MDEIPFIPTFARLHKLQEAIDLLDAKISILSSRLASRFSQPPTSKGDELDRRPQRAKVGMNGISSIPSFPCPSHCFLLLLAGDPLEAPVFLFLEFAGTTSHGLRKWSNAFHIASQHLLLRKMPAGSLPEAFQQTCVKVIDKAKVWDSFAVYGSVFVVFVFVPVDLF